MTRQLCRLCVWAGFMGAVGVGPAWAQDDEPELGWADTAELSLVFTGGNAEANTFGFKNALSHRWENANLLVDVSALRAETTTVTRTAVVAAPGFQVNETSVSNLTAANYYARGRYDRNISDRFFWFAGTGWDRNTFAGIEHRYTTSGGVGNSWVDGEATTFRTSYGVSMVRQDDVVDVNGVHTFASLRLGYDYRQQLTDNTEFTSALVAEENLDVTEDFRTDLVNAVTVNMSSLLALTVRWQLLFDNQPSLISVPLVSSGGIPLGEATFIEADKVDNFLTFAVVASF